MGNEQSTDNGSPSLAGLEAVLLDPSLILGESQQAIAMRTQIAAQSNNPNTLSGCPSNPQAIPLLVSSCLVVDSGLHIPVAVGLQVESQIREAQPEILDMLNPLALFPSTFIDGGEESLPATQALAQFKTTSGYITFLLINNI